MDNETQQKLAESLTADTKDIIPFLPYLLQDFWELGSSPADMSQLVKEFIDTRVFRRFLDLGCGKGAISITLAKDFGVQVTGIDIIDEFIIEARRKAEEHGVVSLTNFECGNIVETVLTRHDYDCVIYGAVGTVLGEPKELLPQLAHTVKPGGYILLDDAYLEDHAHDLGIHSNADCFPLSQWKSAFETSNLDIVSCIPLTDSMEYLESDYEDEFSRILARAEELIEKYPQDSEMFEHYVSRQRNEYDDLLGRVTGATWLLRTKPERKREK